MKIMHAELPEETIVIKTQQSPVWELILGIAGYTHEQLRHTFEMDEVWQTDAEAMPARLVDLLDRIQETDFWYGLLLLQNRFAASSVQEFSNMLLETPEDIFYECLLPYHSRSAEPLKKKLVQHPGDEKLWNRYADLFEGHAYLNGYVRQLHQLSQSGITELLTAALSAWQQWMSQNPSWDKWLQALAFEQKQHRNPEAGNDGAEIQRITGGVEYVPEPSVWTVKLVPHVSYRPWVLTIRTAEEKLFFYPLKDQYLLEPGSPPNDLIHGHKALGDELRLKILFQLKQGPRSLQDLSIQFNTSKTTLHHQLALLKAAKFIRAEKGVYSINQERIESFSGQLTGFLDASL